MRIVVPRWHPLKALLAFTVIIWFSIAYITESYGLMLWMVLATPVFILLWAWLSLMEPGNSGALPRFRGWKNRKRSRQGSSRGRIRRLWSTRD